MRIPRQKSNWYVFALLFLASVVLAQEPRVPIPEPSLAGNLPAQRIGSNDLLSISVYDAPELTRTVRVSDEGFLRLPMLKQKVEAKGLMPSDLEEKLAAALNAEGILVDPVVTVTIAEYHSRPISVAGAVKLPLTFQALGKTTLLEALTRAQGLSVDAGTEIVVTRPPLTPGGVPQVERIPVKGLIDAADPALNVILEGGEEVRVPQIGRIFVVGNVKHPGAFKIEDGFGLTVLKALAMAEGLMPYATKQVFIYRHGDSASPQAQQEVPIDLRKILDRKLPDVAMTANDILYVQAPVAKGTTPERYFHFDSWRVNVGPAMWVPAQIYVEEVGAPGQDGKPGTPRFKAQTRIWDYAAAPVNKMDELTSILIESGSVKDQEAPKDASPLESQRSWERQSEENLLARLEKAGLIAPAGPVDEVLNTVVNNLIVSANLSVEAHCRVMLTTPIETFSIGHTIVISRGLIDVLPDEASLAMVIADELSHIALGHHTQTQFAFNNQTMLGDAELLQKLHLQRSPEEMTEAGVKTVAIMKASPYQKTANAGLFLKELASRGSALPRLLQANLGNQFANADALQRLTTFAASAPALEENKIEQIAALPLGSRVKVNPWNNQIALVKTRPISLLSAREKMPFEITPFALYLTRIEIPATASGPGAP